MHGDNLGGSPEMLRKRQTLPRSVDWTSYAAQLGAPIAKVRQQGAAGSCWVHSALSAAEANHNLLQLKLNPGQRNRRPFYVDMSNALNCLQLRNEQTGRNPYRLSHPAEFTVEVSCTGRLPTLVRTGGPCPGGTVNTPAFDTFTAKLNEFGEQNGVWLSATIDDQTINTWKIGSGLVSLGDWRNVPGYETYDGRINASVAHFKQSAIAAFGAAAVGTCTIVGSEPFTPITNGGLEFRPHDWLAEQQRCQRHSADGMAEGECYTLEGESKVYAFVPENAVDTTQEASIEMFNGDECQLVAADAPAATTEQWSRYWSLAASWDRSQALPRDNGFVSQRPYWLTFSPMSIYEQPRPQIEKALLSMMSAIDHGVTTAAIQTCEFFMNYKAAAHGRAIWHPNCDTLDPPKPNGDQCAPGGGGLHAIVVVGYYFAGFNRPLEDSWFLIMNSWGEDTWGVKGYARLAMGHFLFSQVTLPLLRDPLSLRNPLLPKVNPLVAYSLPPTVFTAGDGELVPVRKIGTANVAQFPLDASEFSLDVAKQFPDVAVASITLTFSAPPPDDLDAVLGVQFSQTNPMNRQKKSGVVVSQFVRGMSTTNFGGRPAPTITFTLPADASDVPASSWFIALVLSFKSATPGTVGVWRVNYNIDEVKSAPFLQDDDKPKPEPTSGAQHAQLAAAAALVACAAVTTLTQ